MIWYYVEDRIYAMRRLEKTLQKSETELFFFFVDGVQKRTKSHPTPHQATRLPDYFRLHCMSTGCWSGIRIAIFKI